MYTFNNLAPGKFKILALDAGVAHAGALRYHLEDYADIIESVEIHPGEKLTRNLRQQQEQIESLLGGPEVAVGWRILNILHSAGNRIHRCRYWSSRSILPQTAAGRALNIFELHASSGPASSGWADMSYRAVHALVRTVA